MPDGYNYQSNDFLNLSHCLTWMDLKTRVDGSNLIQTYKCEQGNKRPIYGSSYLTLGNIKPY